MDLQNKTIQIAIPGRTNDTYPDYTESAQSRNTTHSIRPRIAQYPTQRVFEQPSDIASDRMDTQPRPLNPEQSYNANTGAQQFDPNAQQLEPAVSPGLRNLSGVDGTGTTSALPSTPARLKARDRAAARTASLAASPILIAGSIAAACVLLVGGIAIGSSMSGGTDDNSSSVSASFGQLPTCRSVEHFQHHSNTHEHSANERACPARRFTPRFPRRSSPFRRSI